MPIKRADRRVKMLASKVNHQAVCSVPWTALVCLVLIVCFGDVARPGRADEDEDGRLFGAGPPGPHQDEPSPTSDSNILIEKQNLLILLALREFCLENPNECWPDHPTLAPLCRIFGDEDPACAALAKVPRERPDTHSHLANEARFNRSMMPVSLVLQQDELDRGQSWAPRLALVESRHEVGTRERTMRKINDLLDRYVQSLAAEPRRGPPGAEAASAGESRTRSGRLVKRDQRAQAGSRRVAANTYRVTFDEAMRLIRAHRRQKQASQASSLLLSPVRPGPSQPGSNSQAQLIRQAVGGGDTHPAGHPLIVPKRTDSSLDSDSSASEQRARRKYAATSTVTLAGSASSTTRPLDDSSDDPLKCNMRKFTYRATKTDDQGNQCTGFVMASICYGGCDTGEIADWLFPHKKSIHKVCRHGGRARRQARLANCTSAAGEAVPTDELDSLSLYHYVDALDCVCKRCTPADTTCLGTLSRPHLQTLSEAVGEMGQQSPTPLLLQQRPQYQPQQASPLIMALVDDDEGGD